MAERQEVGSTRLPWSRDRAESIRFGVIVIVMLAAFLVPAVIIPGLTVPEPERSEAEKVPPRLARLVETPAPVEPPEPVKPEPEPEPEPEPVPEPVANVEEVTPPEPTPEPQPEPAKPASTVADKPAQTTEQARETAARSGLFAMKDRLAALTRAEQMPVPVARQANITGDESDVAEPEVNRAQALAGSGGVQDSDAPVREVAVAEHQVSQVKAPKEEVQVARAKPAARPSVGQRAMSNIRQVFDAQKSVLYSLYQRELRQDPTLEGKVTLELVIEPDGSVSACQVVGSELGNPGLEQRIAMRVRMFNFGSAQVETRKVQFPIEFLPG